MAECDRRNVRGREAGEVMGDYNLNRLVQEGLASLKKNEKGFVEGEPVLRPQVTIASVKEEMGQDAEGRPRKFLVVRDVVGFEARVTAPWDITEIDGIPPVEEVA